MTKAQYYYHCLPLDEKTEFAVTVEIPDWLAARLAETSEQGTPLDIFVSNHEPDGIENEADFRGQLQNLLDYIFYLGQIDGALNVKGVSRHEPPWSGISSGNTSNGD